MMMRKLFIEMMGNGDGEMMMRSERRRRRRERDEEPGGAARGAVGPGRSSRRRRGVVVPVLREDCVEDCGVFAVVREAYVVPLDRPFARRVRESKVRVDDGRRVLTQTSPPLPYGSIADELTQTWLICIIDAVDNSLRVPIGSAKSNSNSYERIKPRSGIPSSGILPRLDRPSPVWPQNVQPSLPVTSMVMDTSVRGGPGTRKISKPDAVYVGHA